MIKQISKLYAIFMMTICFILILYVPGMTLEGETHSAINKYIAGKNIILNGFSLHQYLQSQLGMQNGSEEDINNKKVYKWLGDGGETEDSLLGIRFLNHFLDPINNTGLAGHYSALQWALKDTNTQSGGTIHGGMPAVIIIQP